MDLVSIRYFLHFKWHKKYLLSPTPPPNWLKKVLLAMGGRYSQDLISYRVTITIPSDTKNKKSSLFIIIISDMEMVQSKSCKL